MNLLSRLAALTTALLVTVVALCGTAYAKLPPNEPDTATPPAYDPPQPTVVVESGLSLLQVVGLMVLAAVAATVVTAIAGRRLPRIPAGRAAQAGAR
ncbi:hypothetical protein E1218_12730 [Kribbella turkmenica]|uniref:Uncharacterized protein n=1 Tax=Kribbella turkmenica TaxID=2530375 RepID=A0A4R4X8Q8_9ACTN|nr:hypothetical protein [Kribbella turkmenica]TDD26699.1 hypothetical protein E1218_12730 [Kribbella turkmenica]